MLLKVFSDLRALQVVPIHQVAGSHSVIVFLCHAGGTGLEMG